MPRNKKPDDQRAVSFGVTLPQEMWTAIDKEAESLNLNRSQLVRQMLDRVKEPSKNADILAGLESFEMDELKEVARRLNKDVIFMASRAISVGAMTMLKDLPPA